METPTPHAVVTPRAYSLESGDSVPLIDVILDQLETGVQNEHNC